MRSFLALLFLVTCTAVTNAAVTLPVLSKPENTMVADSDTVLRKASISVGTTYGSDILFFGRTGPIKYPYVSTDVIVNSKNGFFVYGSAIKVLGYNPLIDEIDVGAGYLFNYTKNFKGTISYTHFLFNKDAAAVIRSASSNDVNFKNSYDWKIAKSSVTVDYLFGKLNDYFVTLNTSKYIETNWSIFDDKDFLSFNPTISMIMGTQNFVQKYSSDHENNLRIDDYDGDGPHTTNPGFPPYNNGRFRALNYSFKLPIAYNRPHYTFEASWKYSVPVNVEYELKNRHELFFNLTFYYIFF